AIPEERPGRHGRDGQPSGDREESVEPLDAGGRIERREELPVAEGPVRTAEARSGDPNDAAPYDHEERRGEASVDERAIARGEGHEKARATARRLPSAGGRCGRPECARSCTAAA